MLSNLRSLAISSLALLLVGTAAAETRPRYGGSVRVELRAQVRSLDPSDESGSLLVPLVFDTLVTIDSSAHLRPSLAVAWTRESDRRCRFTLERGIKFSDGTLLNASAVAASLRTANPDWTVREVGDVLIVETDQPTPDLPEQLALARNAIALRNGEKPLGTGPFVVDEWQPGARAVLQARDDGWHPRPFVDRVEVLFGRNLRDQAVDMEFGRADLVELSPEQNPPARRIARSDPAVLLALRFSHINAAVKDARVREALSAAIDRDSIANILLQRRGEPAAGLLPGWISGYSFLFPTQSRVSRARQLRIDAGGAHAMTLVYSAMDPLARLVAERVALNAGDAGLTVRTVPDTQNISVPDIELLSLPLPSPDPSVALTDISRTGRLALPYTPPATDSPEDLYRATVAALKDSWAIPVAYVPRTYGLSPRVTNWRMSRTGELHLEDVSLASGEAAKP